MSQTIRYPEIIDIARRDGKVTVEDLATHFGVTLQTIRRDLTDLAEAGRLERVHGGAVLPSGTSNIGYDERRRLNEEAKAAIGRACADAIPNESSVFLNIGTTTEAVARHLLTHRNLLVVTNNMNVATILAGNPDCEVVVTGGALRRSDGGLVGDVATMTIRRFKFDIAVIGCSALDADGDLLDFDMQEVGVTRAIVQHARRVMLVADGSKFQRNAPVRVASLADLDEVITDITPSTRFQNRCRDEGVAVTQAKVDVTKNAAE
ncbi:Glycerol-3-phosphate regulon repressor [Rhodobacteraceae bacterium THAF1]|uniref:DeoR/GlpR family DNA-binding transcription regulator n=1 Tax=Palleronia sp. THAF1 TaxID=2587842 RepID=UPI000F3C1FA3|nr:DeoR/GlpR family DNA-binding transcription regulator [Palleronia sp. THAF1]QFU09538.1 Glycerol-3-phosphate regulon repressor [Palleronia sp. THAF1]VDC21781.1 Glycerol-3-phosphate regulon repressor [Rhodobacteraceae bacterium THAF1]